jgi:hypothetical protein
VSEQKLRPEKRLKNWHRKYGGGMPLRAYAKLSVEIFGNSTAPGQEEHTRVCRLWLTSKGLLP